MEKRIFEKDCAIDNTYYTYGTIDFVPLEEDDIRFNKGKKLLYIGW